MDAADFFDFFSARSALSVASGFSSSSPEDEEEAELREEYETFRLFDGGSDSPSSVPLMSDSAGDKGCSSSEGTVVSSVSHHQIH